MYVTDLHLVSVTREINKNEKFYRKDKVASSLTIHLWAGHSWQFLSFSFVLKLFEIEVGCLYCPVMFI